jgi:hypothetical protein
VPAPPNFHQLRDTTNRASDRQTDGYLSRLEPGRSGYVRQLHELLVQGIMPAAERA